MSRYRRIKTKTDNVHLFKHPIIIDGRLQGRDTYLWFGMELNGKEICIGLLSEQKLYRLAKAIVKQFEENRNEKS